MTSAFFALKKGAENGGVLYVRRKHIAEGKISARGRTEAPAQGAGCKAISAFSSVSNDAHFYLPKLTNFGEVEESVLTPMYESILLCEATVDEALQTADAQLNELLNDQ